MSRIWLVVPACLLVPVVAAALAGTVPWNLFAFPPPLEIPTAYPRFSWWAATAVLVALMAVVGSWLVAVARCRGSIPPQGTMPRSRSGLPWWGWLAFAWTVLWWVLAWNRFPWFTPAQRYTFAPLWFGFIVSVNAITYARAGTCLMVRATRQWLILFGASAVFWWVFEWLNRFVQNWHYPTIVRTDALEYAVHASVCFSTVLPAVAAVRELLGTMPKLQAWLAAGPSWGWLATRRSTGLVLIVAGVIGLASTGVWPLHAYPALWVAPLLMGIGLAMSAEAEGWWSEVARGDWRGAASWALAALLCGFFWELWNFHSLAKWIYTVPYVDRWHVFEMPLLGYTGYLPFGLECALAVMALSHTTARPPRSRGVVVAGRRG